MHPRHLIALSIAGLLLSAAAAQQPAVRPNILLITVDTLRADRVGAYGYARAHTPVMDRLAREGVRFDDATAHAQLTLPSHVGILTGRYAGAFGMHINGMGSLPQSAATMAEGLKSAGYRTGAVVASAVLARGYGLHQGFDDYDDRIAAGVSDTVAIAELQRPADRVTAAARAWLAQQKGPWFLWVHYYDPHLPYAAPPKFQALTPGRPYDAEVAFADAEIGQLLESVDMSRTAVVLTADHGEALGDHGEPDHGYFLYDATLRVPLVIAAPGLKPRVVGEQVRHVDLLPTIAELAGKVETPASQDGESLVPLMNGAARRDVPLSLAESWYPRYHFGWSELKSVRAGEWKYISAPKPELYDLRTDRSEAKNVVSDRAVVAGRLAADLERLTARVDSPAATPTEGPDPAAVERLQALGYLGAFAPVTTSSSGENPKDHIAEYRQYRELFHNALSLLGRNRAAEAAAVLQRLVKMNVRAFEAHLYLGNAYAAQGKPKAALGEYDAAVQLNPQLATPHIEAAKVLSDAKDHQAAAARAQKGLQLAPNSDYAHYTLGVIYRRMERWPEAAAALQKAVELNPMHVRARAALGSVAMRLGQTDRAAEQFTEMVRLGYQVAPAQFNLGVIAAGRGDTAEAARRFHLALDADPGFKPARDALARLKGKSRVP